MNISPSAALDLFTFSIKRKLRYSHSDEGGWAGAVCEKSREAREIVDFIN